MFNARSRNIQITLVLFVMALVSAFGFTSRVAAQAQVCPDTGDWVKINDIDAQSYTYEAPEGKLIIQTCYKAGTEVVYEPEGDGSFDPGKESVTVESTVLNSQETAFLDISHASFRLADAPPPPDPGTGPTPDPTQTPTPDPTPDPGTGPTPDPTDEPTPDPTAEPTPDEETPPAQTAQATPAPAVAPTTGAASGPAVLIISAISALGLSGLSLGAWLKGRKK